MKKYPVPENEAERLERLKIYDLLNLGKDPDLDVFAEAACLIADCPASLIAMMELETQTIQSCVGISLDFVARRDTVCQYTIMDKEVLVINDTFLDDRSSSNALIREGGIRFYAGVPLIDDMGFILGTVCVIDYKPKTLSAKQIHSLKKLGEAITKILISKRKNIQAEYFSETFTITNNIICVLDNGFKLKNVNPAFENAFLVKKNEALEKDFIKLLGENNEKLRELCRELPVKENGIDYTTYTKIADTEDIIIEWQLKQNISKTEIFCFGRNVTQERQERHKLESSERRFRNFFENAIGLMSMHDMEGNILAVNEKGREVLKYAKEEVTSLNLKDLVPADHLDLLNQYLQRVTSNKEDSGMMILQAKDGKQIYWMYHNMVETDETGSPYVVSTALNMTERIQLERDLINTKKILEQTSTVAQVGGWEMNLKSRTIFWSESTRNIHKVDKNFIPDFETSVGFYEKESEERLRFLLTRAIEKGISYDEELQLKRQDGTLIWVRVKGIPEFEGDNCVRIFGIIQDIDEAKKTYLELERKEAMLQSFVNNVPAAVAMFDKDLNHVSVSKRWKKEFHQDNQDIIGKNLFSIYPDVSEERRKIYKDALKGISYKNENQVFEIVGFDEPQHFNWEVIPWNMNDGETGGVIIFTQNITNSVKTNEELKKAKELADLASKAKSEFLANMSHEIRTPLNGVIGFSDLLLKTPLNDLQIQYLNYINESGNSLLNIINDILDFSKIESGKLELFIDKYNIYDLANQVVNVVLYQAQRKDLELLLNIEQGLPRTLWMDESRIKQVLINLLGNAVKFTGQGEIELKIEKLRKDDKTVTLRFSVRDTGIGIPLEKQQRIFDAFTQEDSSVSKKYGGTGLGLTISNNILKYMGSNLSLTSEIGEGSVFFFDLEVPYELEDASDITDLEIERVLIVDDNENNRMILKHMLDYKNIKSELAANGLEAIQLLMQGERFDVILMDYHMPILSGLETIDKIKELFEKQGEMTPLIVLHTSSEEHEVISSFRQDEKSYCLLKPIKSDELYITLSRAIQYSKKEIEVPVVKANDELSVFMQPLKVLLADDNPVNMALNQRMMNSLTPNAKLIEAVNGQEALDHCKQQVFDVILMDVQMPVMDGIEATKHIRLLPDYKKVPIIGVTAGNVTGEKEKCIESGMSDFLPKPLRQNDLLNMLKKYLAHEDGEGEKTKDDLPVEEYLNMDMLKEQIGDDEAFKTFFLNLVIQELTQSSEKLKQIAEERDLEAAKAFLHKLKGTSGTAGLFKLAHLASDWEKNVDQNSDYEAMENAIKKEITIGEYLINKLINQ
ncbi:response regulator [Chryseobacterium gwangjuense]|uniref:response regulator n=1 Tax=Chryseobacterium gwangjuense TaxID=1069980 RepID=UPI001E3C5867|nr:response regulator [Chryseobacterium gwangjuense]MCE3076577.1 response regulator [Chryseobacterium gwangjuense]